MSESVRTSERTFKLPFSIQGIEARIALLKEECESITEQIQEAEERTNIPDPAAFRDWRSRARMARDFKKQEIAWLIDKHQEALAQARKEKTKEAEIAAKERRQRDLERWRKEHDDDTFTLLMGELYQIICSIESDDNGEAPYTPHEMEVIRMTRHYLKEHGYPRRTSIS